MIVLNKVLEKDEIWVIKLVLFQIAALVLIGLLYIIVNIS